MELSHILAKCDHTLLSQSATWNEIKVAGGISTLADAEEFIRLGADRLGTSRIVKPTKAMEQNSVAKNDGSY